MPPSDRTHTTEFEADTRERLARLEAHQENLEDAVGDISDGQDEVLELLDDLREDTVTEEELQEIEKEQDKNTISRERRDAIRQAVVTVLSVGGALGTYVVVF